MHTLRKFSEEEMEVLAEFAKACLTRLADEEKWPVSYVEDYKLRYSVLFKIGFEPGARLVDDTWVWFYWTWLNNAYESGDIEKVVDEAWYQSELYMTSGQYYEYE